MIAFLSESIQKAFKAQLTPIVGGFLIGALNVLMFLYARPWGVFDGARNWGEHLLNFLGILVAETPHVWEYSTSVTNLSLILGALISALLAAKAGIHLVKPRDYVLGFLGGILMGIGGSLAMGCNVGGFFTSFASFSLAGPIMMVGLIAGAWIGAQIYLFDLGNHPRPPAGVHVKSYLFGPTSKKIQPWLGVALLIGLVWVGLNDTETFSYRGVEGQRGILMLIALAIGFVLHKAHFCFARAFREPFMTGDGKMARGAAVALLVSFVGFMAIKGTELSQLRYEEFFVNPTVWLGSLAGGLIFGIGMVIAGGCASGSMWRAGEGQLRLWLAVLGFALSGALTNRLIAKYELSAYLGEAVYGPDALGWTLGAFVFLAIPVIWVLLSLYNEKTSKFVID